VPPIKCVIEDCSNPRAARQWCHKHYKRWQEYGDPLFIARGRQPSKVEIGERFERLVVLADVDRTSDGRRVMECRCDCGNIVLVKASKLRFGHTRSCGCLQRDTVRHGNTKHG
jgi:hypothetical protein